MSTASLSSPKSIAPVFPPVKATEDVTAERKQSAHASPEQEQQSSKAEDVPPVVRSVLELSHMLMVVQSQWLRCCPGYQGGLFYKGRPFCVACGYRDGTRSMDMEDKGNHMKLKDPLIYGPLSTPVTAMFFCQLHADGILPLDQPIVSWIPELEAAGAVQGELWLKELTPRAILSGTIALKDQRILRDCGVSSWTRPWLLLTQRDPAASIHNSIYAPINKFFSVGSPSALRDGAQQRKNLIQYLSTSKTPLVVRQRPLSRWLPLRRSPPAPSHFAVALLIGVAEHQLKNAQLSKQYSKGTTFEEVIREKIFEPAQCYGAGYGSPKLWRDPNDLFYQPTGQSALHTRFKKPVSIGAQQNHGPALLNGSLNLFAPAEEFAKLLLLSVDTIHNARHVLREQQAQTEKGSAAVGESPSASSSSSSTESKVANDNEATGPANPSRPSVATKAPKSRWTRFVSSWKERPFYDFGVVVHPSNDEYLLLQKPLVGTSAVDWLPSAASFRYSIEHDVGVFGAANCGSRKGRLFSNLFSRVLQHLYVEHVSKKGVDPDAQQQQMPESENKAQGGTTVDPNAPKSETERKFKSITKEGDYQSTFTKGHIHRRF